MSGSPAAARHFERASASYTGFRGRWPLGALRRQELAAVRALAPVEPGQWVLDAGCGDGEVLAWLAERGARAVGIDVTPAMAAACRRRGFAVSVQDMERLGVRACFDWVLCVGALEFTNEPRRAIAALAAALAPGGRLLLLYPRRGWAGRAYAAYHRSHGVPIHLFARDEIAAHCAAAGLAAPTGWRDCALSTVCVSGTGAAP